MKRIILIISAVSLCFLIILLNIMTPIKAGPLGILAIFLFAYLSLIGLVAYFFYWSSALASHLASSITFRKPIRAITFKRAYYYSTVIALAPIMLIGLQSVGSINLYGVLLILFFIFIGCLYIAKKVS
jgi:hypothetical protein